MTQRGRFLLAVAVLLVAVVYFPLTKNYFVYDDFLDLYEISNESVWTYLLRVHGGHVYLVRNLIFYLCHRLFGAEAAYYFWVVLITHLLNIVLVFAIIQRLTDSAVLACFGAGLWGTSPVNEGCLGWYSVYGQAVVATIVLSICLQLVRSSTERGAPAPSTLATWYVMLLVGSTCFGTGIGVTLVFPVVILLLLPASPRRARIVSAFGSLPLVVLVLYAALQYLAARRAAASSETALVWYLLAGLKYWERIFSMLVHLFAFGLSSLLLGFAFKWEMYRALMPVVVPGFVAVSALVAVAGRKEGMAHRLAAFVVVAIGCYGMIAAGRGFFYPNATATMAGASQSRYHYLGPIALTIVVCLLLAWFGQRRKLRAWYGSTLLAVWIALTAFLYVRFGAAIDHHDESREETQQVIAAIRAAIDAEPGRQVRIPNRPFRHIGALYDRREFPGQAAIFVIFFPSNTVDGKRVYFVERDADVVASAEKGTRISSLLVRSDDSGSTTR